MDYDIFLSYSRGNQKIADEFIRIASERGLRVWYDRLISGGQDWRDRIVNALTKSTVVLIFFSEESNDSTQLIKELAIADKFRKLVIPVLLENTEPRGAYLYEMASRNWINLHPDPMARIESLVETLESQIKALSAENAVLSLAVPGQKAPEPSYSAAQSSTSSQPLKRNWFPLRRYDLHVLVPILVAGFVLEATRTGGDSGAGMNVIALLVYMLILAIRNAKINRSIFSIASFAGYVIVGLLLLPFGFVPDWIGSANAKGDEYMEASLGVVVFSIAVAIIANIVQVIFRKIFQRKVFKQSIGNPLARQT